VNVTARGALITFFQPMVKLTFSSVFLILASVFAFASAVPTSTASPCRISSVRTRKFIFTNGNEQAGDSVTANPFSPGHMVGGPITNSANWLNIQGGSSLVLIPCLQAQPPFPQCKAKPDFTSVPPV
jgi:hypothetical protein